MKKEELVFISSYTNNDNYKVFDDVLNGPESLFRMHLEVLQLPHHTLNRLQDVVKCSIHYTFEPSNRSNNGPVTIIATGEDQKRNGSPTQGAPVMIIRKFVELLGTAEGFQAITVRVHDYTVDDPFRVLDDGSTTQTPVRKLIVKYVNLRALSSMIQRISMESLADVEMLECLHHEALFSHMILSAPHLQLKRLIIQNWLLDPRWMREDPHSVEKLLGCGFTTLKCLDITTCQEWRPGLTIMLQKHNLSQLVLCLGTKELSLGMLEVIHKLSPDLEFLGIQAHVFKLPFKYGCFEDDKERGIEGFDTEVQPLVDALGKFANLGQVAIFIQPSFHMMVGGSRYTVRKPKTFEWDYGFWPEGFRELWWRKEDDVERDDVLHVMAMRTVQHFEAAPVDCQFAKLFFVTRQYKVPGRKIFQTPFQEGALVNDRDCRTFLFK